MATRKICENSSTNKKDLGSREGNRPSMTCGQRDTNQDSAQVSITCRMVLSSSQGPRHPTRGLCSFGVTGQEATAILQDRLCSGCGEMGQLTELMKGTQDKPLLFLMLGRLLVLVLAGVASGLTEPP